jgi:type II secretory pathway component GspD/PulD (secretin)
MRLKVLWLCALIALTVSCATTTSHGQAEDPARPASDAETIRFNFKGATFEEVIDFFARATGMPVVWEIEPPQGTLDYLSPQTHTPAEALRILNIILQSKGVNLRIDDGMLYLQKLSEMQKEDIPTFIGELPADTPDEQIVTVVRPLSVALAKPLSEKLASMVASYGAIAALDEQNSLVITETAAQVRRLIGIIDELDREDPDGAIRIIPIRHAKADALMEPLKALMSSTVERIILNKKNQPQRVQVQEMSGLTISHDARTNSIVAKGVESRIAKLEETIALLDVPTNGQGRAMRTFALNRLAPRDAINSINQLFAQLPAEQRPTLLPLNESGKITIVGALSAITEAQQLLDEIDGPTSAEPMDAGAAITVLALEHATPASVLSALKGLLTPRQTSMLKLLAGPDGRSLIVSGPAGDVAAVGRIVPVLDRAKPVTKQVRLVRLTGPDPAARVDRTTALYMKQVEAVDRADDPAMALTAEFDAESRTLTLIGSAEAIEGFTTAMRTLEEHRYVERETRQYRTQHAEPQRMSSTLASLSRQLLAPRDGDAPYVEPSFDAVDQLDLLMVTATPDQFSVIESLITTLDQPDPTDRQFRVVPLAGVEHVDALIERANEAYARLAAGYEDNEAPTPEVTVDALTGNLLLNGRTMSVRLYEQAMNEARKLVPPARTGVMMPLRQAKAGDVVAPLRDLLAKTAPVEAARTVPEPTIEVIEHTNSLYVVAEPAQHQMIRSLVTGLDTFEPSELPPLKLIQVRAADANQLATMLRQRYDKRPADLRREQPVEVTADAATNTLIVTAHENVFDEIRTFVSDINLADEDGPTRETMIYPLKVARAVDVSKALSTLYPEPPMPVDRRGNPMPHLREPREVYVSADAATNTLIIEAPSERRASFEALVEQLDRVELPPTAQLRTYHIERGDPTAIANTLMGLSRQGVLSAQPADGSKPVDVDGPGGAVARAPSSWPATPSPSSQTEQIL